MALREAVADVLAVDDLEALTTCTEPSNSMAFRSRCLVRRSSLPPGLALQASPDGTSSVEVTPGLEAKHGYGVLSCSFLCLGLGQGFGELLVCYTQNLAQSTTDSRPRWNCTSLQVVQH